MFIGNDLAANARHIHALGEKHSPGRDTGALAVQR